VKSLEYRERAERDRQYRDQLVSQQSKRLTEILAENSKLRSALKVIRDMLDAPEHRDITPEVIYQIAVDAIDGEVK
jgi:hypothetical protein